MSPMVQVIPFQYQIFSGIEQLSEPDAELLAQARKVTSDAYAPYSQFQVSAVARLQNGQILSGTNQENASYPVSICAERVLLSAVAALYPGVAVTTMAISFHNLKGKSEHPITPCGICRQSIVEHQHHHKHPIRLLLSGQSGEVYLIEDAATLLPLGFTADDMR